MRYREASKQQEFPMGRRFVWFASVALISASGGTFPLRAQLPVIVGQDRRSDDDRYCDDERRRDDRYCEDRRRGDDPVYRDRDWSRDGELRQPGRNGRGAENGRGKKNGLRKKNSANSARYPDSRYPDSRYPDDRYPDDRYPDDRYPDGNSDVGSYRTLSVDRQYYPTNGQCRLWFADRPARLQVPAVNCDRLNGRVPPSSFILYNYRAWDGGFDWYRYDQQNPGRVPREIVEISRSMRY
jgi:hypothetical protein